MEISQEFLIDLALNIGGYLLAGALSVILYSLVMRRKAAVVPATSEPVEPEKVEVEPTQPPREKRRVEFIHLGEKTPPRSAPATEDTPPTTGRRDRTEIIRIARSMLKAGASNDRIKSVLPISESELALIDLSKS